MSDEAATLETPVVDTSPAVPTPPVTVGSPETILDAIKEKIHSANPDLRGEKTKPAAPKEGEETDRPKVKHDPAVLKELGRLQNERSDLKKRVAELEPLKADADSMREVKALWEKGGDDRLAALAKLGGKDGLDVLAEMVAFFYEKDQEGADPANPKPSAETKALLNAVDELKKEIASLKEGKTKNTEAEFRQQQQDAQDWAKRFIGANKATAEISSREENLTEAADLLNAAAFKIAERDKIDVKKMSEQDANDLYAKALAEVEAEFEKAGQRFSKAQPKEAASLFNPERYARPLSRPTVTVRAEKLSGNLDERMAQIRARYTD